MTASEFRRLDEPDGNIVVLLFARRDCPISNRYAPEVARIHKEFAPKGVEFWQVYPNPDISFVEIHNHLGEYSYPFSAIHDPDHELVARTSATITPEAAVFNRKRELVYLGRIDDRWQDFGKSRFEPSVRDLQQALEATLAGKTISSPVTKAVGCYIADLRKH